MSAHFRDIDLDSPESCFQGFPEVEDNSRGFPIPVKYYGFVVSTTILLIK